MSLRHFTEFSCNFCPKQQTGDTVNPPPGWMILKQSTVDFHICPGCMATLREFNKKGPEDALREFKRWQEISDEQIAKEVAKQQAVEKQQ